MHWLVCSAPFSKLHQAGTPHAVENLTDSLAIAGVRAARETRRRVGPSRSRTGGAQGSHGLRMPGHRPRGAHGDVRAWPAERRVHMRSENRRGARMCMRERK